MSKTNDVARGRRSRVVLTPPRWRQVGDDASHHADDGGKQARSPGRARNKLLKPSRAGMPGDSGATVVTNARAYYSTRAATGASGTRHSPLPLLGASFMCSSGALRRGNAPGRRRPRKRAIQYSEAPLLDPRSCGVLDTPLARSMTASCEAWLYEN